MSHVNLMTDTVIANLPPDALRTILRNILTSNPESTAVLEQHVKTYLQSKTSSSIQGASSAYLQKSIAVSRVMLGCGMWMQSLQLMQDMLSNASQSSSSSGREAENTLSSLDGDIIQAVTAIEKTQLSRRLTDEEINAVRNLYESLQRHRDAQLATNQKGDFDRSLKAISRLLEGPDGNNDRSPFVSTGKDQNAVTHRHGIETFSLDGRLLPRLFTGLWQLSSPSWGVASHSQVFQQFQHYTDSGFTAYDMADHYGDAEVLFVRSLNASLMK